MKWHYDLCQAEPIIRDIPVQGAADIQKGAVVSREGAITTALNNMGGTNTNPATIDDVIGVAAELYDYSAHISSNGTNAATVAGTGVTNYIKVIINPTAIWLAEWSQHADNDAVNGVASADGTMLSGTYTSPGDDCEGTWAYVTDEGSTSGGAGNLFQIGLASTTEWLAVTAPGPTGWASDMKANNVADTYIHIINPYQAFVAGGSINLSAAAGEVGTKLAGNDLVMTDTGAAVVLENYVSDKNTPMEPLKAERNSGRNYDAATCKIQADIQLMDHILLGGGTATAPLAA